MPSARVSAFVDEPEAPEEPKVTIIPSDHQKQIIEWFRDGDGNLIVDAYAGCAKTSTILMGIEVAPENNILLAAFAKRNQEDLADRLENPRAKAQTLHSIGYQAIRQGPWGYVRANMRFDREDDLSSQVTGGMPYGAKRLVAKLCTKARELTPLDLTVDSLIELATDYELLPNPGDRLSIREVAQATLLALDIAKDHKPVKTGVDGADMIYLPLVNDWLVPQYDLVVVDEYQDMTKAQLTGAQRVKQPWGRMVLVGDRHQAIYGFRGADSAAATRLKRELKASELTLPITYRCATGIVELAKAHVPGIEAAPTAPAGTIDSVPTIEKIVELAQPGDFVLSRKNAPLAKVAMAFIRNDVPVRIMGRDIGGQLKGLVRKLAAGAAANSIPEFIGRVRMWADKEVNRYLRMERMDLVESVADKAETLNVLAMSSTSVPHLITRLDYLFSDDPGDGVVCSTVHKAKGLEADRVFILRKTLFMPVSCTCGHWHENRRCGKCGCAEHVRDEDRAREEQNIYYVAVTRAKSHLTWCEEKV